ncbi:cytochrome P450 [Dichotomocladium elegans]|nr:cytochrome P450 [Dichotomocladium elegans]
METLNSIFANTTHHVKKILGSREDLKTLSLAAAASLTTYVLVSRLHDALLGPLSGVPGPTKYKFLDVNVISNLGNPAGTTYQKFLSFHDQYGEIVRLGPRHIMVSNKDMLRQILQEDDMPKDAVYSRLERLSGSNLFSTTDKRFHKQRRRVISPAFSMSYLNSLEPYMIELTEALMKQIDKNIESTHGLDGYGVVDIWKLLQHYALDIIGETAFGKTFNMLEEGDHFIPRTVSMESEAGNYFMQKIVLDRLDGGDNARRKDILQIMIDTVHATDPKNRLTINAIAKETLLFLIAGSETTSSSTGFAIRRLVENPDALDNLRKEVDAIEMKEGQTILRHEQLKSLPYLNAVINEALRIDSISANTLGRCPDRDIVLGGRFLVPKGTTIKCNIYHAHLNPNYWPEPEKFIPERWLEGSKIPADTAAFFPYSIGSRNCIGKNFAQQEMRLSIANLVKRYDFQPIPEDMAATSDRRAFITLAVKDNKFNVKIKRRT